MFMLRTKLSPDYELRKYVKTLYDTGFYVNLA